MLTENQKCGFNPSFGQFEMCSVTKRLLQERITNPKERKILDDLIKSQEENPICISIRENAKKK